MAIYWFTGQPGAGKTTLAKQLKDYLHPSNTILVDGDDISQNLLSSQSFDLSRRKGRYLSRIKSINLIRAKGLDLNCSQRDKIPGFNRVNLIR